MADRVVVYIGPRSGFEQLLKESISPSEHTVTYLESIRMYNSKIRASELASRGPKYEVPEHVDNCIAYADDFGSVLSHVISNFASILEETFAIGTLYVQNPPRRALESVNAHHDASRIDTIQYDYGKLEKGDLSGIYEGLCPRVLGQEEAKRALITTLYKQSVMRGGRPSAILFYGPSGVGKTETARVLSESVGGSLTRVQFSMMQTQEAYEYLYGAEHSKASFARDLLGRESNVILIDEFDKVQPALYNMFYQLFDEGRYVDTNYNVDMSNGLFILTSNFPSEGAARRVLGAAMFSRITSCVAFEDLDAASKAAIASQRYEEILEALDNEDREIIQSSDILDWFTSNAYRYDNMRTLKTKVEKAIFGKLSAPIFSGDA